MRGESEVNILANRRETGLSAKRSRVRSSLGQVELVDTSRIAAALPEIAGAPDVRHAVVVGGGGKDEVLDCWGWGCEGETKGEEGEDESEEVHLAGLV